MSWFLQLGRHSSIREALTYNKWWFFAVNANGLWPTQRSVSVFFLRGLKRWKIRFVFSSFHRKKWHPPNKETSPWKNEFLIHSQIHLCPCQVLHGTQDAGRVLHLFMLWLRLLDNKYFFWNSMFCWLSGCVFTTKSYLVYKTRTRRYFTCENIFYVTYTLVKDNFWWSKKNKGLVWRSYRKCVDTCGMG